VADQLGFDWTLDRSRVDRDGPDHGDGGGQTGSDEG
jgi:hypothetical protein